MDSDPAPRAIVLTAGFGTRLGDLTTEMPKPMLDVGGRPLLEHILSQLYANGIREVALNLHFRPELIKEHFGDGSSLKLRITYSPEPELLGTAGALGPVADFLRRGGPFLVQYGDVLTDQDLTTLFQLHRERQALVTMLVHRRETSNSVVEMDGDGRVTRLLERPVAAERTNVTSEWVHSGVSVCDPAILDQIPDGPADLPRDLYPPLISTGRVFGVPLTGYRCAVDSAERLEEARSAVADGRYRVRF